MSQPTRGNKLVVLKNSDYYRSLEDERSEIIEALGSVSDLMMPVTDLHAVSREKLSTLLCYFYRKLSEIDAELAG